MTLRVVVAEDSLTVRKRIVGALTDEPGFEVVGEAVDGDQAIQLCTQLKPDVLILDMVMPVMSGLAVTEYLMALCPTPILIVSAASNTYEARAAGAVEVLEKTSAGTDEEWDAELRTAVRAASKVKVGHMEPAGLSRQAAEALGKVSGARSS